MFKKDDVVCLKKLSAVESPDVFTPLTEDYTPGVINPGKSLPIDYEVEGKLLADLEEGQPFRLFRTKRNGVEAAGFTTSSIIKTITFENEDLAKLETANSVYVIERMV